MNKRRMILLFFALCLTIQVQAVNENRNVPITQLIKPIYGNDLSEIAAHIEANLGQLNITNEFKRSIVQITLDANGKVKQTKAINHPYNQSQENILLGIIQQMEWSLANGKRHFYLILEIEAGKVNVSLRVL